MRGNEKQREREREREKGVEEKHELPECHVKKWYSGWLSPLKGYFLLYGTCLALYTDF